MIGKLMRSRGMRKFVRNKLAMVALLVIAVYLSIGAAVTFFGVISEDDFNNRWGPNLLQGSMVKADFDERLGYAEWYAEVAEEAMADFASDPVEAKRDLEAVDYFGLRPASHDPVAFKALMDDCIEPFYALYEEFESLEPEAGLEGQAAIASEEAQLADLEQRFEPLEQKVTALLKVDQERASMRSFALLLGTDRQGRSIALRGIYAIKVAILIGLVSALISVFIGTLLGGLAGFYGGAIDSLVVWLYSTFSAIPYIVLLMVLAFMFLGSRFEGTLIPVYVAFCSTFWIGPCRVIRGEVLKLREQEYVQAATAMGFGRMHILLKHILPNTTHLMFINFSLMFIGAIKAEVILSFLQLGVKNEPSWGIMISQSQPQVLVGFMWQIGTATGLMFCLVYAFNILSDALQDAFDPKHV